MLQMLSDIRQFRRTDPWPVILIRFFFIIIVLGALIYITVFLSLNLSREQPSISITYSKDDKMPVPILTGFCFRDSGCQDSEIIEIIADIAAYYGWLFIFYKFLFGEVITIGILYRCFRRARVEKEVV
ncbi:hypothetical protein C2G38_2149098 [Gigaspora rosea]|uniref:Uncharacterized protein n=1 Tax=Gigaspora rosea TaxID=44941 RepID=A0A397U202_9GLOM|nr:hypothetical protein C2G38_2149098 [Gigaspora rosea]